MPSFVTATSRPRRFSLQLAPLKTVLLQTPLHLVLLFLIAAVGLAAGLFLAPQTSALARSSAYKEQVTGDR